MWHSLAPLALMFCLGGCGKTRAPKPGDDAMGGRDGTPTSGGSGAVATRAAGGSGASSGGTSVAGSSAPKGCPVLPCPQGEVVDPKTCMCEPSCDPLSELAKYAATSGSRDCGTLLPTSSVDDRAMAQRCVLDALAAGQAFQLIDWLQKDPDARGGYFYVGPATDAWIHTFGFSSRGPASLPTEATLGETTCHTLAAKKDCTIAEQELCLECVEQVESSLTCSIPRRGTSGKCLGLGGNYGRSKDFNDGECCPGLREVYRQLAYHDVSGRVTSCYDPIGGAAFACVEGGCGDGRCEEPEAEPCGCPVDCPSARISDDADAGL
jgi:hypothetical protein